MKYIYLLLLSVSYSLISQDNSIDNDLYKGNEKVKSEDYLGAEIDYRIALSKSPKTSKALFNLGNTQYQANAYDEAAQQFFRTQKFSNKKSEKHVALHNMGNVYMKKKEYAKAVESYKSALRNNPSDDETRYNYALAKSLLKDENKDNDDKKDQDKEKNEENKNNDKGKNDENKNPSDKDQNGDDEKDKKQNDSDKKDKNQSNDKNEKDSDKSNPEQKRNPGQLSPEQVKSLLEAMNNQEKKVQDKINAKKVKGKPVKTKKDW
jgi:tetratricopeptide (TPR) repeat protein